MAGEGIFREIEVLEARERAEQRRKGAREVVPVEVEAVERGGVEELHRNDAVEGVVVEVESPEVP